MRGVPARRLGHLPGDRRTYREGDGLVLLLVGAAPGRYGGDRRRPVTGEPSVAATAPVGLPPGRARAKLPPSDRASPG